MARPRTPRPPARRNSSKRSPAPRRGPAPAPRGGSAPTPRRGPAPAPRRGPAPAPRRGPAPAPRHAPSADPERTLARQPWSSLRAFLPGAVGDQDRVLARLRAFALELLQWNRGVSNLISHADETRLVERHIAESLAGASVLRELAPKHIVDLGSGGGFPALPLAIAGIGARWTLVESRRNKTLFLRRALERLELQGIKVMTGRLEVLVDDEHDALRCDGFTSRATMRAGPTLALAARIVRSGGHAVLWKGSGLERELV
jgi:16S rRNA (guanine527-N7)-methyltransferase